MRRLFNGKSYRYDAVGDSNVEWAQKFLPQTIKDSFENVNAEVLALFYEIDFCIGTE